MDEHVLGHLFDPFFTTKTQEGGTGLGLSTVYGIVRQAAGAIEVDSAPGEGSRFDVYLPRIEPPVRRLADEKPAPTSRARGTLLVVEDQERLRVMLGNALRESGYEVLEARDAGDAVRIAREHPGSIDLLLSDVVMPHLRGPHLAEQGREARPGIRVLFMSGFLDDEGKGSTAEELRGAALLPKPFTLDVLTKKLREVLEG
jgi:CheY-like chemotaxis protein